MADLLVDDAIHSHLSTSPPLRTQGGLIIEIQTVVENVFVLRPIIEEIIEIRTIGEDIIARTPVVDLTLKV